jgi:prefoldin subunit 5
LAIDQKMANSNDGTRNHYETVGQINTQSLAKLDEAVGILHDVNDRTSDSETKLDRKLQGLSTTATTIATALQGLSQKMSEVATVGQSQLTSQGSSQVLFRDASAEVQGMLKELQEKMQKLQEVEIGATRHLYGIKESFDNLGGALESLKGLSQGVAKQTSLLEATLEEMRTSQRNFARELRAELRELAREQRQTA